MQANVYLSSQEKELSQAEKEMLNEQGGFEKDRNTRSD